MRRNRPFREVFSKLASSSRNRRVARWRGLRRYSRSNGDLPQWGGLTDAAGVSGGRAIRYVNVL